MDVYKEAQASLTIQDPELDFCPERLLKAEACGGKTPSELKLPLVTLETMDGTVMRGVLVYAQNWNPPLGWKRIVLSQNFFASRRVPCPVCAVNKHT